MMEQIARVEEIQVKADATGQPLNLLRRGKRSIVTRITDHWRIWDEWWKSEIKRDYFRIETSNNMVYEIYHDIVGNRWYLSKR